MDNKHALNSMMLSMLKKSHPEKSFLGRFNLRLKQRGADLRASSSRGAESRGGAEGQDRESWHIAFHGTRPGYIRRMMDTGKLLSKGRLVFARDCDC